MSIDAVLEDFEIRSGQTGGLKLGDELLPGTYVLQIAATSNDPTHPKRARAAVQRLSFDVR